MLASWILGGVLLRLATAQDIDFIKDPGVYGPALETVHAFYGQWPTGEPLFIPTYLRYFMDQR